MKKNIILSVIFLSVNMFAASLVNTTEKMASNDYQQCLQHSNKLNNPFDRDQRKITCFRKFNKSLDTQACISLSKKMEYSSMGDELLQDCTVYFGNSARECVKLSKSMNYGEARDASLWNCIRMESVLNSKKACQAVAANMIFPHNKNHALALCAYQNGK
jgi:hypothetical protein